MALAMVLHAIVSAAEHVASTQGVWPKAKLTAVLTYVLVKELVGMAVILPSLSRSVLIYSSLPSHPKLQMQSSNSGVSKRKRLHLPRSHLHWVGVFHVSVARNIPYGNAKRNLLDVYVPNAVASQRRKLPAAMFVHGGAWASGSKEFFSHLGASLAHCGIVTVLVQYTLFPEALAWEQVREVSQAFTWFLDNVEHYGGDAESVTLMGHSAGAHLSALVMWERFKAAQQVQQRRRAAAEALSLVPAGHETEIDEEEDPDERDTRQPCKFIGLAGVYDIVGHLEYERKRGVDTLSSMTPAMGGKHLLEAMSPVHLFQSVEAGKSASDADAQRPSLDDAILKNMQSDLGALDAGLCATSIAGEEVLQQGTTSSDLASCGLPRRWSLLASWGDMVVRPDSSMSFHTVLQEQLGHHHSELIMFHNLAHSDFVTLDGPTPEQALLRRHVLQILNSFE